MKNQILKTQTLKCKNFIKTNLAFKFYICAFYFLFLIFNIAFADTVPPLPIDDLKKIELKYNDTLLKPIPLDTLNLKLFAGNVFGGNFKFTQPIRKTYLFINANFDKNYDFSNYFLLDGNVGFGWLTKKFWHDIDLSVMQKQRDKRHYDRIIFAYSPILFLSSGVIKFNNQLRAVRYFDTKKNNFLTNSSLVTLNTQSPIGVLNFDANILFQGEKSLRRSEGEPSKTSANIGFNDLIVIGDNFFLKPGISYNIEKKKLQFTTNTGFLISDAKVFLNVHYNEVNEFYFDTIYLNVFPYLVNKNLNCPICDWNINVSIFWKDFLFSSKYRQFSSYVNWVQNDTWIMPEFIDINHKEILFNLQNKFSFFKNSFGFKYILNNLNLFPKYSVLDSLRVDFNNFNINISVFVYGKSTWYNQTLPGYTLLSSQVGYRWKFLGIFGSVENIFNKKYEILPNKLNLGRKYFIDLVFNPKIKK